ncbi:MAG: hypothetical protein AAF890_05480, partial [Pseudomonadota bacterium]
DDITSGAAMKESAPTPKRTATMEAAFLIKPTPLSQYQCKFGSQSFQTVFEPFDAEPDTGATLARHWPDNGKTLAQQWHCMNPKLSKADCRTMVQPLKR